MSPVTCHMSPVTCHQRQHPQPQTIPLLTPPLCIVGWFTKTETKQQQKVPNLKFFLKRGVLGFPIKSIRCSTRSRQLSWLQSPMEGKRNNTSTDGRPMNLMKCADCSTKTNKTNSHSQNNANSHRQNNTNSHCRGPSPR